jgi:homoserine O-acetyltransferase
MVKAIDLLREYLDIQTIAVSIGGSLGGQQVVEWAVQHPELFEHLVILAANARHSPWGIAFNEAQRMAIETDPNFELGIIQKNSPGLRAARAVAMLSYRTPTLFNGTQKDESVRFDNFRASGYQQYQGEKLDNRFDLFSYHTLTKAMDAHHVGRHFNNTELALSRIKSRTLVLGLDSDWLFPIQEQEYLQRYIPNAELKIIHTDYGHDGFLVETDAIKGLLENFLIQKAIP